MTPPSHDLLGCDGIVAIQKWPGMIGKYRGPKIENPVVQFRHLNQPCIAQEGCDRARLLFQTPMGI